MILPILYSKSTKGAIQTWQIEVEDNKFRTIAGQLGGKLTTSQWTVCSGKNIGKSNETSPKNQALLEAQAKHKKQIEKGYVLDIKNVDTVLFTEPMLAKSYDDYKDEVETALVAGEELFSQPKLDGVRNVASIKGLHSRNGKPFVSCPHIYQALEHIFKEFPNIIFDGELYADKFYNDFNSIISLVRKSKPEAEDFEMSRKNIEYHIYDMVVTGEANQIFSERNKFILYLKKNFGFAPFIKVVPTNHLYKVEQIELYHAQYVEVGYEGQMIRFNTPYENKRTKNLLKHKQFVTDEFIIQDVIEGIGNRSGTAGYIKLVDAEGKEFDSNIKGTFGYCTELLKKRRELVGKTATVKYFNLTPLGIPRFPYVVAIDREGYE